MLCCYVFLKSAKCLQIWISIRAADYINLAALTIFLFKIGYKMQFEKLIKTTNLYGRIAIYTFVLHWFFTILESLGLTIVLDGNYIFL